MRAAEAWAGAWGSAAPGFRKEMEVLGGWAELAGPDSGDRLGPGRQGGPGVLRWKREQGRLLLRPRQRPFSQLGHNYLPSRPYSPEHVPDPRV